MARLVTVLLQRSDDNIPWGFRIQGGADYNQPLSVQRVTAGSLACQHLTAGDVLIMIEGSDARAMCHFDACQLIKTAGNNVELIVRKANSKYLCAENLTQQEKLEQQIVEERFRQEEERQKRRAMRDNSSSLESPTIDQTNCALPKPSQPSPGHIQSFPGQLTNIYAQQMFYPDYQRTVTKPQNEINEKNNDLFQSSTSKLIKPSPLCFPRMPIQGFQPIVSSPKIMSPPINSSSSPFILPLPTSPPQKPKPIAVSAPTSHYLQVSLPMSPHIKQSLPKAYNMFSQNTSSKMTFCPPVTIESVENFAKNQAELFSQYKSDDATSVSGQLQRILAASQNTTILPSIQQQELQGNASQDQYSKVVFYPQRIISPQKTFSPHRITSPKGFISTSSLPKRTSCSPQRIIPPLPKTTFHDERNCENFIVKEMQQPESTSKNIYVALEHPKKQEIVGHSISSTSPQALSPPLQNRDTKIVKHIMSSTPENAKSNYSTPMRIISPPFQSNYPYYTQNIGEINPTLLSNTLHVLQQNEELSTSSQSSSHVQADLHTNIEIRSQSQELDLFTAEEAKQKQLQKLIEEKVRLEEMMMIAKRRQSISDVAEENYKKEEIQESCRTYTFSPTVQIDSNAQDDTVELKVKEKSKEYQTEIEHPMAGVQYLISEGKAPAIRQEEEVKKLRQENQIRDSKIRKMQERRYEEKLKRNVLRTARDKSCPPETQMDRVDYIDEKVSKTRKSRDRSREIKGKVIRDRSCPNNLDKAHNTIFLTDKDENNKISRNQPSPASLFISSHLKKLNIGEVKKKLDVENCREKRNLNNDKNNIPTQIKTTDVTPDELSKNKHDLGKDCNSEKMEREKLFEILRKDQQRLQEEFKKREKIKNIKDLHKTEQQKQMSAHENLQYEAQKWHEQLVRQEQLNKQKEIKINELFKSEEFQQQAEIEDNKKKERKKNHEERWACVVKQEDCQKQENIKQISLAANFNENKSIQNVNEHSQEEKNKLEEIKKQEQLQWEELKTHNISQVVPNKEMKQTDITQNQEKAKLEEIERQKILLIKEKQLKDEEMKLLSKIITDEQNRMIEERKKMEKKNMKHLLHQI